MLRPVGLVLCVWSLALCAAPVSAATLISQAATLQVGEIAGHVLNGTTGKPVADTTVSLLRVTANGTTSGAAVVTDARGAYSFDGVTAASSDFLVPQVTYEGVKYEGAPVHVSSTAVQNDDVHVYEQTSTKPVLTFTSATLVFGGARQGTQHVSFLMVLTLHNPSLRTFVPTPPGSGPPVNAVLLPLPPGVDDVGVQSGLSLKALVQSSAGLASLQPVLPGDQTISFSFSLPYRSSQLAVPWKLSYPASKVQVLYTPGQSGAQISVEGFRPDKQLKLGSRQFNVLVGSGALPAGQVVTVSLAHLPEATLWQRLRSFVATSRGTVGLVVVAIMAVCLPVGFVVRRGHSAQGGQSRSAEDLINLIAALDDAFEEKQIPESEYRERRQALKRQLLRKRDLRPS
ncbi:MAG: carboxypeptidase-like regulatory domain-containing protein [Chloroflexi bacterium]|nr:carboxypeptidase-like regulatory domain-containing protein [Chloroflexota bacterium]